MIHLTSNNKTSVHSNLGLLRVQTFEPICKNIDHGIFNPIKKIVSANVKTNILNVIQRVSNELEYTLWKNE